MSWRPEGWTNPYKEPKHYPFDHARPGKIAHDAFEMGGERMLKLLTDYVIGRLEAWVQRMAHYSDEQYGKGDIKQLIEELKGEQ